jgi:hypothetical protein
MKYILLTKGKVATVCDCHYHLVEGRKWWYHNMGYAYHQTERHSNVKAIMMHRVINGTPDGFETDHIDRNKLNNQCSNLETVTHRENVRRALYHENNICSRGHLLVGDNVYIRDGKGKRGDRQCRTCRRLLEAQRPHRSHHKKKEHLS